MNAADFALVARGLVACSRAAQGLPAHVEDPTTLANVAALITRNGIGAPKGAGTTISATALLLRERGQGGD